MAMLAGPLIDVKDPGKVRNRRVAKSWIVLIPILIINVNKTLILTLARKHNDRQVGYITLLSIIIDAKTKSSTLMKAYLWSADDGSANWNVNGRQGRRQGAKPGSGKIANSSYSYSYSSY